ncbi:MAG TPA: hypothetical protein VFY91_17090 [Microbacterium sp.]|nr:hypothetical protein [Microbacterium sp.]
MSRRQLLDRQAIDRSRLLDDHEPSPAQESSRSALPAPAPTPAAIVALQRSAGNAAVRQWLSESFAGEGPDENPKGEGETAPLPELPELEEPVGDEGEKQPAEERVVGATITPSGVTGWDSASPAAFTSEKTPKGEVTPTGTTTYDGAAASSTCLPADILPADVDWDVVDTKKTWGVKVSAMRTSGKIKVNPTPNKPADMVTPNTANPVDGGNIENSPGSNNHWKFAVDEMKAYNTTNGGRSAHWHSTAASDAHEYEHWNKDWMKNVLGKLWPKANRDIDKITIPKADAADAAAAKPLLKTKVDARIATANAKSTTDWNAVPDDPGLAGANGYKAGQRVLNGLIDAVKAYAKSKKW